MSKSAAERTAELRARRKAEGYRILHCHLPREAADSLDYISARMGGGQARVIALALENLAQAMKLAEKKHG